MKWTIETLILVAALAAVGVTFAHFRIEQTPQPQALNPALAPGPAPAGPWGPRPRIQGAIGQPTSYWDPTRRAWVVITGPSHPGWALVEWQQRAMRQYLQQP